MKKIFTLILMMVLGLTLSGCSLLSDPENEAPTVSGDSYLIFSIGSDEPDWTSYVTALDPEDGDIRITTSMVDSTNVDLLTEGIYEVKIYVEDSDGKTTLFEIDVEIIDDRVFTFTLIGLNEIDIEVYDDFVDPGVVSQDNNDNEISYDVSSTVNMNIVGEYTITYSMDFIDVPIVRTVNVVDTTPPVIEISNQTISDQETDINWSLLCESAFDNYDSEILVAEIEDNVNYGVPGEYTVILSAEDSSENIFTKTFSVTVSDTSINIIDNLPDEPITITFWHIYSSSRSALLDALILEFETLYPNITVESISQGSYTDLKSKTIFSIVSGTNPDLIVGYPDHFAEYINGDALIPLDDFIENDTWGVDLTDFIDSYVAENQQYEDGMMYSMPYSKSTEVLMYNKTVFDFYNIELPTDRAVTWAELEVYAETIVGDGPMQCDYLINYDSSANLFINSNRQWDGLYTNVSGEILVNNNNTLSMLDYLSGLFTDKTLALPLAWDQSYGSANFLAGDVCMTVGSTAGISYNIPISGDFELGIALVPQYNLTNMSVVQQGPNIAIMSNTSDAERLASWLLIKHLTSTEASALWSLDTGYLPVRYSSYESSIYQEFLNNPDPDYIYESMSANAAYAQLDYFRFEASFANRITSSDVREEAGLALESIYVKSRTVSEAIENMLDQLGWEDDIPIVIPGLPSDVLLAEAVTALLLTDLNEVTEDLTLPIVGLNDSIITWTSTDLNIVAASGEVTRPVYGEEDAIITLTATITIGEESSTKEFTVRVMAIEFDFDVTISEFISDQVVVGEKVIVTGVVFGIVEGNGFQISDGTAFVMIYAGSSDGVALGDTVKVTGEKIIYYGLPEVYSVTSVEVLTSGDTQPAYEVTSIIDLFDEDPYDTLYSSKPITITGIVSVEADGTVVLTATSAEGMAYNIVVYYKSFPAQITALTALTGEMVTVDVIVYGYHDGYNAWRVTVAEDATITSVEASDAELALWEAGQLNLGDLTEVIADLTLPVVGELEGTIIAWASDNQAIINDIGVISRVAGSDTTVVLTATITVGVEVVTRDFTVTVKDLFYNVISITVAEAIASDAEVIPDGTLEPEPIFVQGIVTAIIGTSSIVLQDATGGPGIVIYTSGFNDNNNVELGDEVILYGTHDIYYGLQELTSVTLISVISSGNEVQLSTTITLAEIVADLSSETFTLQGLNVVLTNLEVIDIDYDVRTGYIVVGDGLGNEIIFSAYDIPYSDTFIVGDIIAELSVIVYDLYYSDGNRVIVYGYPE